MADMLLSLLMAAGLALSAGAVLMLRRGNRKQAVLMLLAALAMFGNVAIWLAPNDSGASLANSAGSAGSE